jgi:hypothetical protein
MKIIGISGYARAGKDTFAAYAAEILEEFGLQSKRIAFADSLKKNINSFLLEHLGITSFTQDDDAKLIIRPLLVAYGAAARKINKDYWIEQIKPDILNSDKTVVKIITDVRYENECKFIQSLGGKIVVVSQPSSVPANDEEKRNQPLVDDIANHKLIWPKFGASNMGAAKKYVNESLKELGII